MINNLRLIIINSKRNNSYFKAGGGGGGGVARGSEKILGVEGGRPKIPSSFAVMVSVSE